MDSSAVTLHQLLTEIFILLDISDRQTLGQHNLSIRQFYTLHHLSHENGLSVNDLSRRLLCGKSNTTRLVERMKQDGLLTRKLGAVDRRYVSVNLTDEGEKLYRETVAVHHKNVINHFKILSADEQTILENLLGRLRDNLRTRVSQSPEEVDVQDSG